MPRNGQLPISCPHCQNDLAKLTVRSQTIVTVTCANCGYTWALELAAVPALARAAVELIDLDRDKVH